MAKRPETKSVPVHHVGEMLAATMRDVKELHAAITTLADKIDPVLCESPFDPEAIGVELESPCPVEEELALIQEAILAASIRIQRLTERART